MNYEIVDKELGIASCIIGDLTINQVNGILQNWNNDSSISTMTLFYDYKQKLVVLNREHKNYKYYLDFTVNFLRTAMNDKRVLL